MSLGTDANAIPRACLAFSVAATLVDLFFQAVVRRSFLTTRFDEIINNTEIGDMSILWFHSCNTTVAANQVLSTRTIGEGASGTV